MNKETPGYTFTFYLEKPVDIDIKIINLVIQAYERVCVAKPNCPKAIGIVEGDKLDIYR